MLDQLKETIAEAQASLSWGSMPNPVKFVRSVDHAEERIEASADPTESLKLAIAEVKDRNLERSTRGPQVLLYAT